MRIVDSFRFRVIELNYLIVQLDYFSIRSSCSASYNPALPPEAIDTKCTFAALMPAKKRSMGQSFYICWHWASEALKAQQKRRRTS